MSTTDYRQQKNFPLGFRNNNPGNIRPGYDWQGAAGVYKEFVTFSSLEYGIRALALDLINKWKKGRRTIREIIEKYAPPSENDTESYIKAVVVFTGQADNKVLTLNEDLLKRLIRAIVRHENGKSEEGVFFETLLLTDDILNYSLTLLPALAYVAIDR